MMLFRLGNHVFRPGLWPTLAAAFFFGLTLWLGNWQLSRADYKQALQQRYDRMQQDGVVRLGPAEVDKDGVLFRSVEVRGEFVPAQEILLDNRVYKTMAGYHVLTPLRIEGGERHVLVNRGWAGLVGGRRDALPASPAVAGTITLRGIAVDPQSRYLEFKGAAPQGKLWQNLNFGQYQAALGKPLQPVLILQTSDTDDGLVRDWPRPDTGVATHLSYAIQWFGLAGAIAVLWLVLNVKREKERN
jgi:surfeit locus 1 family protein